MDDIMKVVKSVEESGLLIKGVSATIKNEAEIQKSGFDANCSIYNIWCKVKKCVSTRLQNCL